jgi:hypothetical protein
MPTTAKGEILESMQVTIAKPSLAVPVSSSCSKVETKDLLLFITSSNV